VWGGVLWPAASSLMGPVPQGGGIRRERGRMRGRSMGGGQECGSEQNPRNSSWRGGGGGGGVFVIPREGWRYSGPPIATSLRKKGRKIGRSFEPVWGGRL